jgi:hypothetical protein
MAKTSMRWAVPLALAAVVCLCAAPSPLHADGVTVALLPTGQTVTPGAEFDLTFQVTQAGDLFNGFDAIVSWDPAALTFISRSKALQEGAYMSGACGNTFYVFKAGAASDTLTDVLLCNNTFLTGPGTIFKLHFKASDTPQVTTVSLHDVQFYKGGMYVTPVHTSDAILGIGVAVGVGEPPAAPLALSVAPNPGRGPLRLALGADRAGIQRLTVHDVQGRRVRRLADGWAPAGSRVLSWDGGDESGLRLPAGIYMVTLEVGGRTTSRRVTLLR